MPSIPTYLMNRNGIWYFNYRIPVKLRKLYKIKSQFIRRSLKTSDVRQAVLLSKKYISIVMGDKKNIINHPELLKQLNIKIDQCQVSGYQMNDTVISDDTYSPASDHLNKGVGSFKKGVRGMCSPFTTFENYSCLNNINTSPYPILYNNDISGKTSITIGTLISKYIVDKANKKEWKERTLTANSRMLQTIQAFLEYSIGSKNPMIHLFKYEHAELFESKFRNYPKNCKKIYPNKSLPQIMDMIDKGKILYDQRISAVTYNEYAQLLMSIFKWAKEKKGEKYLKSENVFVSLKITVKKKRKEPYFYDTEIKSFFNSDIFIHKSFDIKFAWRFWVPIIMLYHGMRVEEVCQLLLKNIIDVQGIVCFAIRSEKDCNGRVLTTTKNADSIRNVPIHPKLIEIGFLKYVNYIKKMQKKTVFPSLSNVRVSDGAYKSSGAGVSKFFNEDSPKTNKSSYITRSGIDKKNRKLTLYSFRHTVVTLLMNHPDQIDITKIKRIIGHEVSETIEKHYGGYNEKTLLSVVKKIRYPNALLPWDTNENYNFIRFPWE